ncbi:Non-specific serine/threonine protein kinase protein [Dioscorea alata]|uniref:Non-specific serine/threonine protein kinase protein n=1 Tax=Dioscorea alata TaxID=55571 RepID=A0ACB7WDV3_DIOAL|nr:Non-specific serine/threonine protein kinase protein [Dioscorea alata]
MKLMSFARALPFLLVFLSSWSPSAGDPRTSFVAQFCNSTQSANGSLLADYFVPAMDNLSSLVHSNGYGTTVYGQAPNAVYALGQCLGDLDSIDCQLCFSEIRSQLPKCYPKTGGRIYLDGCFGRYENYTFFNQILDANDTSVCNNTRNSSNTGVFTGLLREIVGNVTSSAVGAGGYAVNSASNSGSTVYVLAQCWQNLNKALCNSCLTAATSSILGCAPALEGRALFAGCFIRYSNSLFWNTYQTNSSSSGNSDLPWIIPVSVVGALLLIVGFVVWWKIGRKKKSKYFEEFYQPGLAISQSNLHFKYGELKKATGNFSQSNKLGQGSYGTVYKAVLSDNKEVAVKRLLLNTRQWIDQFFNEVNLVNQVRHKNLVKLLGFSVDGPESLLLYEYFANRSLDLFIFDTTPDKHLDWDQRYDIIQGVAEGLAYLHEESETRIIHRDIKASNILLDDKFKPKITDFGLARSFPEDQTHLSTGVAGTLGYMAPEYVVHGHLTEKADVYSFGMLILEIVTGKKSSNAIGPRTGQSLLSKAWNHYRDDTLSEIIAESIYMESAKDEIVHVIKTGLFCTQANPHDRPTMLKVVELLRNSKREEEFVLTDPPFLDVDIDVEEGEVSCLLTNSSAQAMSTSSLSQFSAR